MRSFSSDAVAMVSVLPRSSVLTPFVVIQKSPNPGAFSLFVLVVLATPVLSHDLVYGGSISQYQVIRIHTAHV
jgi:hypothetical protein